MWQMMKAWIMWQLKSESLRFSCESSVIWIKLRSTDQKTRSCAPNWVHSQRQMTRHSTKNTKCHWRAGSKIFPSIIEKQVENAGNNNAVYWEVTRKLEEVTDAISADINQSQMKNEVWMRWESERLENYNRRDNIRVIGVTESTKVVNGNHRRRFPLPSRELHPNRPIRVRFFRRIELDEEQTVARAPFKQWSENLRWYYCSKTTIFEFIENQPIDEWKQHGQEKEW